MAPPAASSDSGKRKHQYDENASANKHQRISPQNSEDDASGMNEAVHDGSMEPFPQRPAYDKGLHDVYKKNKMLAVQLLTIFNKYSHISKELQNMQSKAVEAVKLHVPDRVMVALVGGTGAGKHLQVSYCGTLLT
jgi:ABC-type glutathione transport system ATPase component